jgi:hypothetical protein
MPTQAVVVTNIILSCVFYNMHAEYQLLFDEREDITCD